MQEPLADLERAFSMVFTVEKQRQVHTDIGEVSRQMVYQLMLKDNKKDVHGEQKLVQVQVEGTSNRIFVAAATLDERATSVDTTTTELCLSQNIEEFA
ncbi:UNVERIFIED_CONTAM: hypothetical protein Sindi_3094300, partial [Sesamum indicum]